MRAYIALTVLAAGLVTAASSSPAAPASTPATASAPSTRTAERLEPFIRTIRQTDDFRAAMAAYARACAIDNESVDLNDAYMRRLLQLGLPQIAYFPARVLTGLDRANGTAWGVLAYYQGLKGELTGALVDSIRAVERVPNDPSVLNNAGQLIAWYDSEFDQPDLPASVRRSLDKLREGLIVKRDFQRAYERIRRAYEDVSAVSADLQKKIAAAEAEVAAAEQAAADVLKQLNDINTELDYYQRDLDWYDYYYRFSYLYPTIRGIPYAGRSYPSGLNLIAAIEMRDRVQRDQLAIEQLKSRAAAVRRDGEDLLNQYQRKSDELAVLKSQANAAMARVAKKFRWDPPAVDGVVTTELDRLPPDRARIAVPSDPQAEATQRLDLAKLYIRNDMTDKAVPVLEEVVKRFPAASAAVEAKAILAQIQARRSND